MKYVIIRDDDTNALTPVEYLERLYRPFLDRGFSVNLATIPNVRSDVCLPNGEPEGFLVARNGTPPGTYPIGSNRRLVDYLRENPGYKLVQHGYHHEFINKLCEFDHNNRRDIANRLDKGARYFLEAGFLKPKTFVAPYDRMTRTSYEEVAKRFQIISTGWFELGRMPYAWWPKYALKKLRQACHWKVGGTFLLSHPGCHLSYHRAYDRMLDEIIKSIEGRETTVLVTHWWEFFRGNKPDDKFIQVLHETAEYLGRRSDVKVISFEDVLASKVSLN